jgi:SAM-dependent methyltransferase
MARTRSYLRDRRGDVHSEAASSQFRWHARQLRLAVSALLAGVHLDHGARVLDLGSADSPYREELPPGVEYVAADLPGNPGADVALRADGTVPLKDATFDLILSTQVLEHVDDPALYLDECRRLTKPGASLLLSTHGVMYFHPDPEDYWRWTRAGLAKLLSEHGFEIVDMKGVLGPAAAALQIFQDATIWRLPARLQRAYAFTMQGAISTIDRRYTDADRLDNGLTIVVRAVSP